MQLQTNLFDWDGGAYLLLLLGDFITSIIIYYTEMKKKTEKLTKVRTVNCCGGRVF